MFDKNEIKNALCDLCERLCDSTLKVVDAETDEKEKFEILSSSASRIAFALNSITSAEKENSDH